MQNFTTASLNGHREMEEQILQLQKFINGSRYTVAITGAGISMSAGIMDFAHMNFPLVLQMSSSAVLKSAPNHYYNTARKAFLNAMFENGPSIAHRKLAEYERRGLLQGVITTNIDCLHTLAGSRNVAEIQGSFGFNKCLKCGQEYNDVQIWNQGKAPRCEKCGGVVGAFPVYKHIGLVEDEVRKARSFAAQAELVIIIGAQGSYGGVYYPYIRSGAKIVQINPKATQFDDVAVLNIRKGADEVFPLLT